QSLPVSRMYTEQSSRPLAASQKTNPPVSPAVTTRCASGLHAISLIFAPSGATSLTSMRPVSASQIAASVSAAIARRAPEGEKERGRPLPGKIHVRAKFHVPVLQMVSVLPRTTLASQRESLLNVGGSSPYVTS